MTLRQLVEELREEERKIAEGGGAKAIVRQHQKGRLAARERIPLDINSEVSSLRSRVL